MENQPLADRLIEKYGALSSRDMQDQVLDSMDLERERGITIKAQTVSLKYELNSDIYKVNIIDTPGHVDFSYEVSRSLSACDSALSNSRCDSGNRSSEHCSYESS